MSAYDPATTHAGLTQRAAMASALHAALVKRFGRPLGLFEPVPFAAASLPDDERRFLKVRLDALDPAGGYRPGDDGVATSMAWLVAGSVIAWTPAERGQNSFYDPSRGAGLRQGGGIRELGQSLRLMFDGGSLRGWATGTDFDLDGPPSTAWVQSARNDVGLTTLYDQLELSVAAGDRDRAQHRARARAAWRWAACSRCCRMPASRRACATTSAALFSATTCRARPDRSIAAPRSSGSSPTAMASPVSGGRARRSIGRTVLAYFTATDFQGLADRTQRRFYSAGTVPEDGVVDRDTTSHEVCWRRATR